MEKKLEVKTLKDADCLTSVSEECTSIIGQLHENKCIVTITNGFDPDEINIYLDKLAQSFTITYTGTLKGGKQDPSRLFKALKELILEKRIDSSNIKVRFYGPSESLLENKIKFYGLESVVEVKGFVPRNISFEKQRESHLLLLLLWDNQLELKWMIPGKIFEYLAARRPILVIGGSIKGETYNILENTKAGVYVSSVDEIKSVIEEYYNYYIKANNSKFITDLETIKIYSQREMAGKFAHELNELVKKQVT